MPLYAVQFLPTGARLGLWHLTETPTQLWPLLPDPAPYRPLLPATTDLIRQAQWLAARVLTHQLLAAGEPLTELKPAATWLINDADGRPQLAGRPGAAVSLSHSGEWVAALLAPGGRVGVDVEQVRDKARRLAPRFLSDTELAWTAQPGGTDPALFSLLWSAKETLYKLAGQRGLIFREAILVQPFAPAVAGGLNATLRRSGGQTRHRVCYTRPAPGYVLTYCHEPAASN